jgi:predicted dehydrogenase
MSADYLSASMGYKFRKIARYIRLFGLAATIAKSRAQFHMRGVHSIPKSGTIPNTRCRNLSDTARSVAFIGCGKFAYSVIGRHLSDVEPRFLRAAFDVDLGRAVSLCRRYGGAYATNQLSEILKDDAIDIVYVASNHASHAEYAAACLAAGKAVHIEKPHAVSRQQVHAVHVAMTRAGARPVFLGFNRPKSSHFGAVASALGREAGPYSVNWFIGGHEIDEDHWYYSPEEGGRVLGNLCHWLDASLHLVGEGFFPVVLHPSSPPGSKSDFVLTLHCGDGSIVVLTFSAKGHTFEGVREVLNVQRGGTLVLLRDFHETRISSGVKSRRFRTRHRDHGHAANICHSYNSRRQVTGEAPAYVRATGMLAVAAAEALERGNTIRLTADGDFSDCSWPQSSTQGQRA